MRVVSMPSMDVFEEQPEDYKEKVLPKAVRKRVAVEALGDFGWGRYVGLDGTTVTMKALAPAHRRDSSLRNSDLRLRTLWQP